MGVRVCVCTLTHAEPAHTTPDAQVRGWRTMIPEEHLQQVEAFMEHGAELGGFTLAAIRGKIVGVVRFRRAHDIPRPEDLNARANLPVGTGEWLLAGPQTHGGAVWSSFVVIDFALSFSGVSTFPPLLQQNPGPQRTMSICSIVAIVDAFAAGAFRVNRGSHLVQTDRGHQATVPIVHIVDTVLRSVAAEEREILVQQLRAVTGGCDRELTDMHRDLRALEEDNTRLRQRIAALEFASTPQSTASEDSVLR